MSAGLWDLRGAPEVRANGKCLGCLGKVSSQVTQSWKMHGLWSELRKHKELGKYFYIKKNEKT